MAKRKLTNEERLKRIKTHNIVASVITILGIIGLIILLIIENVYPDIENWITKHGYTVVFSIIFIGIAQKHANKKLRKNPDLYDTPPDERDIKIDGQIMTGTVATYVLLSVLAFLVTFILSLFDKISIFVPTVIGLNLFALEVIQIIVSAIVKKKNS